MTDAAAGPARGEEMVQLLDATGARRAHPDHDVHLEPAEALEVLRDLVLLRRLDAEAEALQRQGELGLWAGSRGQEAAQVGAARALRRQDHVFPSYRDHGFLLARGVDPLHLLSLFRGVDHGGWDPVEHGVHPYTLVIAAQMLPAVGYAMGVQRDGAVGTGDPARDTAVVACFGDGATSQGEAAEALNWAAVYNAPVVFLCQNNQWAISEPVRQQSTVPLHRRAEGAGVPGVLVDGNDVLAVLSVVRSALERARSGGGPTFVEAYTYRMGAHTTADDPGRYRDAAEVDAWREKDPIDRFRAHLRAEGVLDDAFEERLAAEADAFAERLRAGVQDMADPEPASMFEHAYAEPHPQVVAERDEFLAAWARHEQDEQHATAGRDR
ncbi:pyruvate dehydrogenase (acetyl-transferring) E1 component subunit alpha [Paenibacillus sp. TRM 82003]|uniref:pyruvate dehydrogenase (acetyl-transferring) E1 component subunit alpha n=1 Tax=Kineococcus sp. TRM81007 TaxID=2925831 RepID=UPI001F56811C|nr:pyruvate dehydrogenase (acetyl-transferring) E1 component subunit alpha [Kineococcus sp. TRM81007]MCI2236978.1 pyruvate dehydrogenase (acetyl-transferring) E1 component subunit alpha [Kineococcus sp. TRM81007]MCI3926627.1 pyruvate dehydrogenase (acetyl-transferring) E1 component subunit alpha [Paenibacillus sp. TRM 82003]